MGRRPTDLTRARDCQPPTDSVNAILPMADSSSRNAVSFSSARTTKRLPSSRRASTIQIVRPSESTAETQPQLQPALLSLSAMISHSFTHQKIDRFLFARREERTAICIIGMAYCYMLWLGLRLIESNFPVLGLGPPLCSVYVAPLPAGSIHSLPLAQSPRRPSSMSLDSHRLHSRRELPD